MLYITYVTNNTCDKQHIAHVLQITHCTHVKNNTLHMLQTPQYTRVMSTVHVVTRYKYDLTNMQLHSMVHRRVAGNFTWGIWANSCIRKIEPIYEDVSTQVDTAPCMYQKDVLMQWIRLISVAERVIIFPSGDHVNLLNPVDKTTCEMPWSGQHKDIVLYIILNRDILPTVIWPYVVKKPPRKLTILTKTVFFPNIYRQDFLRQ